MSENNVTYVKKPIIIVKPLVTEAPTEKINDINVPTIEKLLVDIKRDQDFAYLQGSEAQRMWEIGESLYNINQSRLKRYAKRRGLSYNSDVDRHYFLPTFYCKTILPPKK